mmetsp:Transcript_103832/g.332772  ORF Transcript_103832/g.332772 Transcript_103832/m.332772 type:complete len:231 (+) Transcript_103832:434-1126(+)
MRTPRGGFTPQQRMKESRPALLRARPGHILLTVRADCPVVTVTLPPARKHLTSWPFASMTMRRLTAINFPAQLLSQFPESKVSKAPKVEAPQQTTTWSMPPGNATSNARMLATSAMSSGTCPLATEALRLASRTRRPPRARSCRTISPPMFPELPTTSTVCSAPAPRAEGDDWCPFDAAAAAAAAAAVTSGDVTGAGAAAEAEADAAEGRGAVSAAGEEPREMVSNSERW